MKHYLYISLTLSALALAACVNDETLDSNHANEVGFDVVANNATRTATLYGSSNTPTDFYVYSRTSPTTSVTSGILYMDAQRVTSTVAGESTTWSYGSGNTYVWPLQPLDFYVFADKNIDKSTLAEYDSTDGSGDYAYKYLSGYGYLMTVEALIPENAAQQNEIVYAVSRNITRNTANGKVPLVFNHALAQMTFQFKCDNPSLYVEVDKVTVTNIFNYSAYAFGGTTYDGDSKSNVDGGALIWGNLYAKETDKDTISSYQVATSYVELSTPIAAYKQGNSGQPVSFVNSTTDSEGKTTVTNDGAMVLIPQKLRTFIYQGASSKFYSGSAFIIHCRIYSICKDADGNFYYPGNAEGKTVNMTQVYGTNGGYKDLYVPLALTGSQSTYELAAGKKYVITFNFSDKGSSCYDGEGNSALVNVSFNAKMSNYSTGTTTDSDISVDADDED